MGDRPTILAIAGEPSGDQHTAGLGEALLERADVRLLGVGQTAMEEAGFELLCNSSGWGGIGLYQSLIRCPMLHFPTRKILRHIFSDPPDLLVLVDFGAFNVRLARRIRRRVKVPVLYYFPPRSWCRHASGYWRLRDVIDRWATPFSWSAEILQSEGLDATWVGHPVVDRISPNDDRRSLREEMGLPPEGPVIGLLPGSRSYEISSNGPVMLKAAGLIKQEFGDAQIMISRAPSIRREAIERMIRRAQLNDARVEEGIDTIARVADVVITSAGTATLELTAAACPMVVMYRGTTLMRLEELFRRIGRMNIALPNIVANRKIVPELTAWNATPARLAASVLELLNDPQRYQQMRDDLMEVRGMLGPPGVAGRVADIALEMLGTPVSSTQTA
ncbi:MAG: lipid-A-disaccharide synthase [Armatimonadetes bacterium]|nr:lipid-A-disaccharide synthase [Armatimonadota bacterium]